MDAAVEVVGVVGVVEAVVVVVMEEDQSLWTKKLHNLQKEIVSTIMSVFKWKRKLIQIKHSEWAGNDKRSG